MSRSALQDSPPEADSFTRVQEVSERSPSTSPTSSPSAPSKLDTNASLTALDPKVAVRRRSLFQPTPQPPKEDSSTSSRSRSTSPEPSSKPTSHHSGLDRAVEGLTLADVELDKPDVLPRRKRNLSQPHATSTATSRPTSAASREKESTNAGSSTISSRARSRTPSLSRSASTSNIREAASSPHDVEKQPTIRKRRSSSSLAAASTTGKSSGSLIVRTRIEASTSTPSTRTPSSQEFGPGAEVEKALDRITTLSRRSSISNVPPTRRAVSAPRPRELSPALGPESPMLDDEDDAPAMTPPPEVDMDGLLVKRRLPTSRSDEMQTLTEENESIRKVLFLCPTAH